MTLAKRLAQAQNAQEVPRGKFFSNYARYSSLSGMGYDKPPSTIQFDMLKMAKDRSMIDRLIIMARTQQGKNVAKRIYVPGKQVGFRVVHENYADPNFRPTADVIRRCKEMERLIENVNPEIHTNGFVDFMAILVDMVESYDHTPMVIVRDRTGAPSMFHLIDGTTVRPKLQVIMKYMADHKLPNKDSVMEHYYKETGMDLSSAAYVQVVNEVPVATWTKDEMSVYISNPSVMIDQWAYGAGSHLEQSLALTQTWLNAWAYNDGLFNQDSPESMLMLYGDIDPIGLGAFQRQILDQTGSGDYQKIPVVQADEGFKAELIKMRELPKDLQFAEFLRMIIQLKTSAYRAHPSIVNFSIDKGGNAQLSIGNNSEDSLVKDAKEEGFQSLIHGVANWLTKTIIRPRYDDLVLLFDLDLDDENRRIEILNKQLGQGGMTFNEWRRAQGLQGDLDFGDIPNSPVYSAYAQAMQGVNVQGEGNNTTNGAKTSQKAANDVRESQARAAVEDEQETRTKKNLHKSEEKIVYLEIVG
jgi:hypothetical protein